jgi:hypothetical protein
MPTSVKVASQAGKDLGNPKTAKVDRGPIAAALSEAKGNKKVGGKKAAGKKPPPRKR